MNIVQFAQPTVTPRLQVRERVVVVAGGEDIVGEDHRAHTSRRVELTPINVHKIVAGSLPLLAQTYSMGKTVDGGDLMHECVSLQFSQVTWKYKQQRRRSVGQHRWRVESGKNQVA